jgi:hypothetical protein
MKTARNFLRRSTIQRLENRSVMAANLSAVLTDGVLEIIGTDAPDTIEVRQAGDMIRVDGVASGFSAGRIKEIVVRGLGGDDSISVNLNDRSSIRNLVVHGGDGNDRIQNGTAIPSTMFGDRGDDVLVGGSGADYLSGGDGNDFIIAGRGNDVVVGGNGNDQVFGGDGNDRIWGEAGDDVVFGEAGDDMVVGGAGDDKVFGGYGADELFGSDGQDLLSGNAGHDRLIGGAGHDELFGGAGDDTLWGEDGNDALYGGSGSDNLYGGSGANRIDYAGSDGPTDVAHSVSAAQLAAAVDSVIARWTAAGVRASHLANIDFRLADLPGTYLGLAVQESDGRRTVWLDENAAGKGWFVDATPHDNSEYLRLTDSVYVALGGPAATRMDLVSLLGHELGHMAGLEHSSSADVMSTHFDVGVRMLPDTRLAAQATGSHEPFVAPGWPPASYGSPGATNGDKLLQIMYYGNAEAIRQYYMNGGNLFSGMGGGITVPPDIRNLFGSPSQVLQPVQGFDSSPLATYYLTGPGSRPTRPNYGYGSYSTLPYGYGGYGSYSVYPTYAMPAYPVSGYGSHSYSPMYPLTIM